MTHAYAHIGDRRHATQMRFDFAGLGKSEGEFGASGFGADIADLIALMSSRSSATALTRRHVGDYS